MLTAFLLLEVTKSLAVCQGLAVVVVCVHNHTVTVTVTLLLGALDKGRILGLP